MDTALRTASLFALGERLKTLPRTEPYQEFLASWGETAGLRPVFKETLDEAIAAEILAYVEPFCAELTRRLDQMAEKRDPVSLALGRLLGDLLGHLEGHAGACDGCEGCVELGERVRRCQGVLGYR